MRRPLYLQVRDTLASRIAKGEWQSGHPIPNEVDLAFELGVSTGTVRKAMATLEDERLIVRRQGRGTFVADLTSNEMAIRFSNIRDSSGHRIEGHVASAEVESGVCTEAEGAKLNLNSTEDVIRVRRIRQHDERPLMVEKAVVPARLFPQHPERPSDHTLSLMAHQNGILLGHAQEQVSIEQPDRALTTALGLPAKSAVLKLDRLTFTLDGLPIEWRVGHCHLGESKYLADIV
jgi:GntR family transcriptional regulator